LFARAAKYFGWRGSRSGTRQTSVPATKCVTIRVRRSIRAACFKMCEGIALAAAGRIMLKTWGCVAAVLVLVVRATYGQAAGGALPKLVPDSLAGRDSFEMFCAGCHGPAGRGDGLIAPALKTRPADLTSLARRHEGVYPRELVRGFVVGTARRVPAHGTSEMPAWGTLLGAFESAARVGARIDSLVAHIESLQAPSTLPTASGSRLFRTYCASCHGATGRGEGPLAGQLRRDVPDLTKFTAGNGGVFPRERVYRIVDGRDVASHGDRDMPMWGDVFRSSRPGESASERIDAIVTYLEGIQERGTH
jgi:mono/diheme cytochrome c family protein